MKQTEVMAKMPKCPVCGKRRFLSYDILTHSKARCRGCGAKWEDRFWFVRALLTSRGYTEIVIQEMEKERRDQKKALQKMAAQPEGETCQSS